MSTDFRALCAELLPPLAEYDAANPYHDHRDLIARALAALAKPQPHATASQPPGYIDPRPTDKEINEMVEAQRHLSDLGDLRIGVAPEDVPALVHDALARWGRTTTPPIAATNMEEQSDA
jgi:hypothetical protein